MVLYAYGIANSDKLCRSTNPMLIKECDALESNNTKAGWESMVNIPAITGSYCKTYSASVKCTWPDLLGTFFLMMVLLISLKFVDG